MTGEREAPPREWTEPDVAFEFGNDPAAPRAARTALGPLHLHPGDFAADVSLVASELVSNVVLHTRTGGHLHAWDADPLRLEVHDHDSTLPTAAEHVDERGGRGLEIVDGIADEWGTRLDEEGKTLWANFRRPEA
ncbi:MAG: sle [Ilumatobacteraceae bacterium]|nr:sle [Ilumatobacteraceae bacterium]MCU1391271.1 sle [Ilumatobacteraceae bacterium]